MPQDPDARISDVSELDDPAVFRTMLAGFSPEDQQIARDGLRAFTLFGREFDEGPRSISTIIDRRLQSPDQPSKAEDFSVVVAGLTGLVEQPIVEVVPSKSTKRQSGVPPRARLVRRALSLSVVDDYRIFEKVFGLFSAEAKAAVRDWDALGAYVMELCELTAPQRWGDVSIAPLTETPPTSIFDIDVPSRTYLEAVLRQKHIVTALGEDPALKDKIEDPDQLREELSEEAIAIGNILLNARAPVDKAQIAAITGLTAEEISRALDGALSSWLRDAKTLKLSTIADPELQTDRYSIVDPTKKKRPAIRKGKAAQERRTQVEVRVLKGCRDFFNILLANCDQEGVHQGEGLAKQYREALGWSKGQWGNYKKLLRDRGYIKTENSTSGRKRVTKITVLLEAVDRDIAEGKLLPLSAEHPTAAQTLAARWQDSPDTLDQLA
ncbi:MAG TPA: hypothetical protein VIJ68_04790 [Candidatus Saccharimonadales bacterium]